MSITFENTSTVQQSLPAPALGEIGWVSLSPFVPHSVSLFLPAHFIFPTEFLLHMTQPASQATE